MSSPQPTERKISRLRKQLSNRLVPIAQDLDKEWQKYCGTRVTEEVIGISSCDVALLGRHRFYNGLKGICFVDVQYYPDRRMHAGPLPPGVQCKDPRLRKAILNFWACTDVCIAFWECLMRKLKGELNHMNHEVNLYGNASLTTIA